MSKPVTNVEIEDVLSSIRRLVSSSDRAERPEDEPRNDISDKLVLTPALRVDNGADEREETLENQVDSGEGPEGDEAAAMAVDVPLDDGADTDEAAADGAFLDYIARAAESVGDSDAAEEDEGGLDDSGALSDHEDARASLDDFLEENADNLSQPDIEAESDLDEPELAEAEAEQKDLQRRAAEFEALIAERDDAWDPDGSAQDENAAHSVGPVPWEEDADGAGDDATAEIVDPLQDSIDALAAGQANEADNAEEDTAELDLAQVLADAGLSDEDVTESAAEEASEDAPEAEETSENVEVAEEASEADDDEEALQDVDPEVFEPEPAAFAFRSHMSGDAPSATPETTAQASPIMDEALLDEEALREMVSEIVRQELQGALGERITRNVRKLVRREIHRALASQELE